MTQLEVATRLGISQAAYSRMEKGEVELSIMRLILLSDMYDVRLNELLKGV